MKDAALTECPQCQGVIKRLLYPVGIVFKGSGWYINDSRKPEKTSETDGPAKTDNAAETKPASDATATKETKETKPAAPSAKE
jgi:predicted nucleic acid-binding Zn ribbon protein